MCTWAPCTKSQRWSPQPFLSCVHVDAEFHMQFKGFSGVAHFGVTQHISSKFSSWQKQTHGNFSTYANYEKKQKTQSPCKTFHAFQLEHGDCGLHVLFASCAIVCCCQTNQQLRVWLGTKPYQSLVIVQSVIFLRSLYFFFPFSLSANGLFFLSFVSFLFSPFFFLIWRRCRVHAKCTGWKCLLSPGDNTVPL